MRPVLLCATTSKRAGALSTAGLLPRLVRAGALCSHLLRLLLGLESVFQEILSGSVGLFLIQSGVSA